MDSVTFVKGQMEEYISDREFSLNFEDRKIASVKVRKGETVLYDGEVAAYTKATGEEVKARCPSLKAAILSGWLRSKNGQVAVPNMVSQNVVGNEYDPLKGGSFDEFVGKNKDIHMARSGTSNRPVENYNARILRPAMPEVKPAEVAESSGEAHEVTAGETPVREIPADKERLMVTSSTVPPKAFRKGMQVVQANNAGAQTSIQMTRIPKKASKEDNKVKTTLIDGNVMTGPLPADATLADVKKAYGGKSREVVHVDGDTQNATVVKKIGEKIQDQTRSEEGITFRKTMPARTNDARAKTSMGEPSLTMDGSQQKVVKVIGKTAAAHPEAQEAVPEVPPVPELIKKEDGSPDYLSMLPDNWARMHWVQKEKFILQLNDVDFIKFIMQVETIAAVRNACTERLKQLGQAVNG